MLTYPKRACLDGSVAELFKLVSYGATSEEWGEWLRVPLEHAAARGNLELINKLLEAGANGSHGWRFLKGRTLLDAAAVGGDAGVVSALLRAGAQPGVNVGSGPSRRSALYVAAKCGHEDAGSSLILAGADVLFWDPVDQRNVISEAARGGHTQLVRDMLMAGAHADEHFYENPLHLAIGSGSESVVDTLILAGADPNIVDNNGNTPLICAADLGHTSMIKTLLAAGADASHCAHDGRSALHAAAKSGEEEMVSALLNKGVDINVCDENGETPLVSAVKAGKNSAANSPVAAKALKAAKALLAAGAVVKTRGNDSCSALDWAATNGHADIVKAFLRHGAKANGCDVVDGRTALHRAAASTADTEDAIKALIDGGADINAYNEKGYTPLTDATRRFDCKSMLALLRNGADPNALGFHRNSALHEACMRRFAGLETVVDLLLRWGADDAAENDDRLWPEEILDSGQAVYFGCSAEEIARTRRLLAGAGLDRIWRRRGWLIILRSRELEDASIHSGSGGDGSGDDDEDEQVDETGRAARLRHRTGKSAADRREGGCGSDAREAAKGFSLMKMLPKIPEDLFQAVVSFL